MSIGTTGGPANCGGFAVAAHPLGGFTVVAFEPHGGAEQAGVALGDRIAAVNGFSVVGSSVERLESLILQAPRIELVIIRGEELIQLTFNRAPATPATVPATCDAAWCVLPLCVC
jgi:predicted metalloprotease with PDZ domain